MLGNNKTKISLQNFWDEVSSLELKLSGFAVKPPRMKGLRRWISILWFSPSVFLMRRNLRTALCIFSENSSSLCDFYFDIELSKIIFAKFRLYKNTFNASTPNYNWVFLKVNFYHTYWCFQAVTTMKLWLEYLC